MKDWKQNIEQKLHKQKNIVAKISICKLPPKNDSSKMKKIIKLNYHEEE